MARGVEKILERGRRKEARRRYYGTCTPYMALQLVMNVSTMSLLFIIEVKVIIIIRGSLFIASTPQP